jgi:4-carboxymuconolactone decarboxylase
MYSLFTSREGKMARIAEITAREDLAEENRPIYDAIMGSRKKVDGPFALLLHSPEVAGRVAHLGTYLRFESVLSPVERELAILVTAREFDCEYEWHQHTRLARVAGVREEAIDAIANRQPLDRFNEEEALLVAYGRELLSEHRVSSRTFEAARARFGEQGLVDLTGICGYYAMMACSLNAFEVPSPGGNIFRPNP